MFVALELRVKTPKSEDGSKSKLAKPKVACDRRYMVMFPNIDDFV